MPNEFKIRNGLVVDSGGATVTGSITARQTGFNASGIFTGDSLGGIALTTTSSNGFSVFTIDGALQIYDNVNAATRFTLASGGGISANSFTGSFTTQDTVRINNQSGGTPAGGTTPGVPTNAYGSDGTNYLGTPIIWLKINLDGTDYYFPGYE
jgi:hypothetical protein